MKPIKLVLTTGFLVLGVIGCSSFLSPTSKDEGEVTFKTTQRSYSLHDTVTAVLQNHSAQDVSYNLCTPVLQQKNDGKWSFAGPPIPCTLEAIVMKPGGQAKYQLVLNNEKEQKGALISKPDLSLISIPHLAAGTYRLKTSVTVGKYDDRSLHTHSFQIGIKN
jgi:hypothetical protein